MEIMTKVIAKEGEMPGSVVLFTICKQLLRDIKTVTLFNFFIIFFKS